MGIAFRRFMLVALLVKSSVALATTGSLAQEGGQCACTLPPAAAGEIIGQVTGVTGEAMVSQAAGYAGAVAGEGLSPGSRVMVGPLSSASVLLGATCSLTIADNQTLKVDAIEGGICVSLEQPQAPPVEEAATGSQDLTMVVVGALGIGGVAGIAIAVGSGDDDPASD